MCTGHVAVGTRGIIHRLLGDTLLCASVSPAVEWGQRPPPLQWSEPCWGDELLSSLTAPGAGWGLCLPRSASAVISSPCSGSACTGTWQLETWGGDMAGSGGTGQAAQFGRRCWGTRTSQLCISGAAAALSEPPSCCALSEHSAAGQSSSAAHESAFQQFQPLLLLPAGKSCLAGRVLS